ncbi:unnamed protein product [Clonostachys chloroleuca]|uniref:NADP-dependent oxidoreductase domain-containing protein n=1 Tax=Clonostachys chloroleuca TaxID=1926264 RepID=A0AA35M1S3_9HYPO|nr:unnamed protein product [Clonostachys chloroleuca]
MATERTQILRKTLLIGNAGLRIPILGFGVYKIPPDACKAACLSALRHGYRHIDCAQLYKSEAEVAAAVAESHVPREEVFLTTKIKQWRGGADELRQSLLKSIEALGGGRDGYVDLFLIHTPRFRNGSVKEVWLPLEKFYAEGRVKAIGVSNFGIDHLEELKEYASIWPPHVNQIELHPWCQQRELVKYCRDNNIIIQAYSPLATGARFSDPNLKLIATKNGKSSAQVLIRYSLQKGWIPLPKSEDPERIRENAQVFDFELDDTDMSVLDGIDEGKLGARFPANVT